MEIKQEDQERILTENQNPPSKPFCIAPFINFYYKGTRTQADLRPCCESRFKNSNSKENTSYQNFWTGLFMQDVREKMLQGIPHDICKRCIEVETAGGVNSRKGYQKQFEYAKKIKGDITFNIKTGNNFNSPLVIDFRASNLCNLKCRMCHSASSSEIAKEIFNFKDEYKLLGEIPKKDQLYSENKDLNPFIMQVPLDDLVRVKFLGGEPLMQEDVYKGLELLSVRSKNSKGLRLSFTTNATNFSERFLSLVGKVGLIILRVSLDGTGTTYEYIRTNGNWQKIKSNIDSILDMKFSDDDLTLGFSFIIQAYSVFNIKDFLLYCKEMKEKKYKNYVEPFFSPVEQDYLSTAVLTDDDLADVIKDLEDFDKIYPDQLWTKNIRNIIVNFDKKRKTNVEEMRQEFKLQTNILDEIRKTSIINIDSRFKKYL